MGGALWDFIYPYWDVNWWCHCDNLVQMIMTLRVNGKNFLSYLENTILQQTIWTSRVWSPSIPLLKCSLSLRCKACIMYVSIGKQLFSTFCLIVDFCHGFYLLWKDASLMNGEMYICEYKDRYLECSWELYGFRNMELGFSLGSMTLPLTGSCLDL